MPNYKEKIAEFENNFSTVIDKSVRDLSMAFDNLYLDKNAKEIPPTIKLAEALLSGEHNISTKMQIHYDIANAYHDLRMIEGVYSERYLEKELYHLRCALDMYETNYYDADSDSAEVKVAQYIAMRSYTNLGNAYRALGRHIVAIDCFQDALLISNDFAMASLNLSFLLFRCAPLQIKRYEQSYYHHACYYYYKQTERCKINLEDQDYLEGLKSNISLFDGGDTGAVSAHKWRNRSAFGAPRQTSPRRNNEIRNPRRAVNTDAGDFLLYIYLKTVSGFGRGRRR